MAREIEARYFGKPLTVLVDPNYHYVVNRTENLIAYKNTDAGRF